MSEESSDEVNEPDNERETEDEPILSGQSLFGSKNPDPDRDGKKELRASRSSDENE